jgi:hypothetical protein
MRVELGPVRAARAARSVAARRAGHCCSVTAVNADDDQRADDLEAALDEGDVGRAAKMANKWSTSNAEVALGEVQRRSDAHRRDVAEAAGGDADLTRFTQRDADIAAVRELLV